MLKAAKRAFGATACATIAAGLFAAIAVAGPIEDRQKAMEGVGEAMKVLASIAKKEKPFDAATVRTAGEAIAGHLAAAKNLFPEGSEKGEKETWAKAEIWSDRPGFEGALEKGHSAALKIAEVGEEQNFMPALQALGGACKQCHDQFRRPKE